MSGIFEWISINKEWVFSGVGVPVIGIAWAIVHNRKAALLQKIKSGSGSTNIQVGRDIQIGNKTGTADVEDE